MPAAPGKDTTAGRLTPDDARETPPSFCSCDAAIDNGIHVSRHFNYRCAPLSATARRLLFLRYRRAYLGLGFRRRRGRFRVDFGLVRTRAFFALLARDIGEELRVVALEKWVAIGALVFSFGHAAEAVEVELSLEGREVVVAEVLGQDFGHEGVAVRDHEGVSAGQPVDHRVTLLREQHAQLLREAGVAGALGERRSRGVLALAALLAGAPTSPQWRVLAGHGRARAPRANASQASNLSREASAGANDVAWRARNASAHRLEKAAHKPSAAFSQQPTTGTELASRAPSRREGTWLILASTCDHKGLRGFEAGQSADGSP
eukprot:scaffold1396_cov252-Pinguiococcus_pyrenoidosus.AAC.23